MASHFLKTVSLAAMLAGLACSVQAQTLTLWGGSPELEPFYNHVAAEMKASHPDFELKVETISLREHEKRLAFALPAGSAADIVEMQSEAPRYVQSGLLAPAPEAIAAFVKDPKNFSPVYIAAVSDSEHVYGVPLYHGQSALYYNTEKFAKAGLSGPPKTADDYSQYAAKLTERDASGNPTISGWSLRLSGGGQGISEKFWINLHQFGGKLVEKDGEGWKAAVANEAGRKALKQYLDQLFVAKTVSPQMKADAEAFELGQTAMFIRESWVIGDIAKKAPNLKYATAPLPTGSLVVPASLFVPADNDKSKLAWEFVQKTNAPENLQWLLDNVGWLPSRSNVDFSAIITKKPVLEAFVAPPVDYTYFSLPPIAPSSEILTRFAARLEAAFANPALAKDDAAIDAMLKEASGEIDNILKREGLLAQ
ncbi:ABC transporter substrate-binding protein [Rhizobium lusitanum]|uniref:Multiple sugar transport system substrate-binding protein n=1 Tax=Rhizobium lusitanum TaxID=293958 RepID=A0A7X0MDA9_9HYPH|nr:extracellular solute-binding protein [Rhizobium lusitanum]MBB6484780.1 multiple sugar transport system substrate-binding protein [Rhizobium lusitanum]